MNRFPGEILHVELKAKSGPAFKASSRPDVSRNELGSMQEMVVEDDHISGVESWSNNPALGQNPGYVGVVDRFKNSILGKSCWDRLHGDVTSFDKFEGRAIGSNVIERNPDVQAIPQRISPGCVCVTVPLNFCGGVFSGVNSLQERVSFADDSKGLCDEPVEVVHDLSKFSRVNGFDLDPSAYFVGFVRVVSVIKNRAQGVDVGSGDSISDDLVAISFYSHRPALLN